MTSDPRTIAARLGVDEQCVRRIQARGHLLRLDLSETDIRERLYAANAPRPKSSRRPDEPPVSAA